MKADNLKLAPVTLGFLNIIFNLSINIDNAFMKLLLELFIVLSSACS